MSGRLSFVYGEPAVRFRFLPWTFFLLNIYFMFQGSQTLSTFVFVALKAQEIFDNTDHAMKSTYVVYCACQWEGEFILLEQ